MTAREAAHEMGRCDLRPTTIWYSNNTSGEDQPEKPNAVRCVNPYCTYPWCRPAMPPAGE